LGHITFTGRHSNALRSLRPGIFQLINNHTALSYSAKWTFTGRSLYTCIFSQRLCVTGRRCSALIHGPFSVAQACTM